MGELRDWQKESQGKLKIEGSVEMGVYCVISATDEGITIGRGVKIGHGVKIFDKSTIGHKKGKVIIKKNVWIGSNAVICPDVVIGQNAVISALTLVPAGSRIPANQMWGGTPAKFIKETRHSVPFAAPHRFKVIEPGKSDTVWEIEIPERSTGFIEEVGNNWFPNTHWIALIDGKEMPNSEIGAKIEKQIAPIDNPKSLKEDIPFEKSIEWKAYNNSPKTHAFEVYCKGRIDEGKK